jgi:hypothetical protein
MPIIASLAQGAFDPEALRVLQTVFDFAWETVTSSDSDFATNGRAASAREALGRRIIATAERGETDPRRLLDDALLFLATVKI